MIFVTIANGATVFSADWSDAQPIIVDATAIVGGWVPGNTENQGLVLFGLDDGTVASQASYLENAELSCTTIPEPSSMGLVGLGLLGLLARRKRQGSFSIPNKFVPPRGT